MGRINIVKNAPRKKVGGKEQRVCSFSAIDNSTIGKNKELGLEAKGLYLQMVSVAGTDFDCTAATLAAMSKGKVTEAKIRKTQRLLNELIKAGLVERQKVGMRYEESLGKKIPVYEYTLFEVPNIQAEQQADFTAAELAALEQQVPEFIYQEQQQTAVIDIPVHQAGMAARISEIHEIGKMHSLTMDVQLDYLVNAVKKFKEGTGCNASETEIHQIAELISQNLKADISPIIRKKKAEFAR